MKSTRKIRTKVLPDLLHDAELQLLRAHRLALADLAAAGRRDADRLHILLRRWSSRLGTVRRGHAEGVAHVRGDNHRPDGRALPVAESGRRPSGAAS